MHPFRMSLPAIAVRRPALGAATLGMAAVLVAGLLRLADPYAADSLLPPCPFHALTHLYCPGCGTTRALHALVHGDLVLALSMNPLAVMAVPMLPAMLLRTHFENRRWLVRLTDARLWLVLVLVFAVARNLPWIPFQWLAPG